MSVELYLLKNTKIVNKVMRLFDDGTIFPEGH